MKKCRECKYGDGFGAEHHCPNFRGVKPEESDECDAFEKRYISCPFCGEGDENFDLRGLKTHLERGWCEVYNELEAFF